MSIYSTDIWTVPKINDTTLKNAEDSKYRLGTEICFRICQTLGITTLCGNIFSEKNFQLLSNISEKLWKNFSKRVSEQN